MISPRTALAGGLLAALTTVLAGTVRHDAAGLSWWYAASWALFAAAALALRKVPGRQVTVLLLAGSAAVAATGLVAPPRTSTDAYRYAWDGRVQAAGISPYDHAPADPELAPLRVDWLFPHGATCQDPDLTRLPAATHSPLPARPSRDARLALDAPPGHITRPALGTPPTTPSASLPGTPPGRCRPPAPDRVGARARPRPLHPAQPPRRAHHLSPARGVVLPRRVPARPRGHAPEAVSDRRSPAFRRRHRRPAADPAPPRRPPDGRLVGLVPRRPRRSGEQRPCRRARRPVRRRRTRPRRAPAGGREARSSAPPSPSNSCPRSCSPERSRAAVLVPAAAVVALAYLPYILDSDGSVLGYLGGYVDEEGYGDAGSGSRYALLRLVLPGSGALPVLLVVLLGVCVYVIARGDPERPWSGALLVTGTAFLLLTPGYSWYALLLVALVALDGRGEWLLAAAAVLTGALLRRRKSSVPAATSGPAAATEGGKESNRPPTPKAWDS